MSLPGHCFYTERALRFALIVEPVWLLGYGVTHGGRRGLRDGLQGGRFLWSSLLVFYLAALVQITVIRGGIDIGAFWAASHDSSAVQLVPLWYTLQQARAGWWARCVSGVRERAVVFTAGDAAAQALAAAVCQRLGGAGSGGAAVGVY